MDTLLNPDTLINNAIIFNLQLTSPNNRFIEHKFS
jgi:hypothetical protein